MTEEETTTTRKKRANNLPEDVSPPTHVLVSTETFNHVVRSLRNSTEAILNISEEVVKISQDNETLRSLMIQIAENQANLSQDIREIHQTVTYKAPTVSPLDLQPHHARQTSPVPPNGRQNGNGNGELSADSLREALKRVPGVDDILELETPLRRAGQVSRG